MYCRLRQRVSFFGPGPMGDYFVWKTIQPTAYPGLARAAKRKPGTLWLELSPLLGSSSSAVEATIDAGARLYRLF